MVASIRLSAENYATLCIVPYNTEYSVISYLLEALVIDAKPS